MLGQVPWALKKGGQPPSKNCPNLPKLPAAIAAEVQDYNEKVTEVGRTVGRRCSNEEVRTDRMVPKRGTNGENRFLQPVSKDIQKANRSSRRKMFLNKDAVKRVLSKHNFPELL